MKSTSIVLLILGAITAVCLNFLKYLLGEIGELFFIVSCVVFLIVGIFNLIFMIEKKADKKIFLVHIIPLAMFVFMVVYLMVVTQGQGWRYIILLLVYLIPHVLSFGAHLTHIEYITKTQAKDKRIADLEAEISRLKG